MVRFYKISNDVYSLMHSSALLFISDETSRFVTWILIRGVKIDRLENNFKVSSHIFYVAEASKSFVL